jgi:hypothetical protein
MAYLSQYPTAQDTNYVKSTSELAGGYSPFYATDPTKSLTGTWIGGSNTWLSNTGSYTNQRFHIDLGKEFIIKRIYYENAHDSGGQTTVGAKNFTLWGSNTAAAFADLTYATDTNWTQLTTATSLFLEHTASDVADPQYIVVTNSTSYRYYAFKFSDAYNAMTSMGLRRVELQTEDIGGSFLLNFV